ncbi:5852_t:CDS:2 [Paraglomus occultum]|uniref:5852_t:CDS:1 n=1 Tax=Paraglomus occultum TaxID=144539 RepID=A0A9N8VP41_9GLOM|nr:5852_t:CDS:2 [Paraglomus occultum]
MGNPIDAESFTTVQHIRSKILNPNFTTQQHIDLVNEYGASSYKAAIYSLSDHNVALSVGTKARTVVALWATKNYAIVDEFLTTMVPAEVFKTVQLLDAPRKARQWQKKLDYYTAKGFNVRATTKARIQQEINNSSQESHSSNLTSSFARRIRKWCKSFPQHRLDFFLLNFTKEPWKELADLVHLRASDFQAPYFLPMIYGAEAPPDSSIAAYTNITTENLENVLVAHPYLTECYSYIRQKVKNNDIVLNDTHKTILVQRAPLEDVLWFYEELCCAEANTAITTRLLNREPLMSVHGRANYSKLMERILTFRKLNLPFVGQLMDYAEEKLATIELPEGEQHSVAVFGDCSSSMGVAVQVATIIGSLLSVYLKADLTFFNSGIVHPPLIPRGAADVITVTETIRANGSTSPAATLYPYYEEHKHVDVFIVVTDEEENTRSHSYSFASLFKKYREEIVPHAQVFFVSFLKGNDRGQMITALEREGITDAQQFRLDGNRPDLSKFDELLGVLAIELVAIQQKKQ